MDKVVSFKIPASWAMTENPPKERKQDANKMPAETAGKQASIGHFQTAEQNAGKKTILKEICGCFGYGTKQNDKSAHLC